MLINKVKGSVYEGDRIVGKMSTNNKISGNMSVSSGVYITNIVQDGKYLTIYMSNGNQYTFEFWCPEKGVDYFTEEDIQEIVNQVIQEIEENEALTNAEIDECIRIAKGV